MADYLLEIGTEEIPAKFISGALVQLKNLTEKNFLEHRIKYESIRTLGTPRRLTLLVNGLAEQEEDLKEEVKGPSKKVAFDPMGQPTKAVQGFARSQGVTMESLIVKKVGNVEYVFALKEVKGRLTEQVLSEIAPQLIMGLSFPKPMRWGNREMRFARPIHWLVSLFDEKIVSFELEGLLAGRNTRGHRFLGQESIDIKSPSTYIEQLKENYVLVDQNIRKEECWSQIKEEAKKVQGVVEENEKLLEEVTFLLEWPTALTGSFSEDYLKMPEEVIITPMREHQRYFPVRDKNGVLLNRFITVRNGNAEHLEIVRAGNEKVLKARLADARFFWEEDQKVKLEQYLSGLKKVVFQESLGTVFQKTERVKGIVSNLSDKLGLGEEVKTCACRAAQLAKADLVTNMVCEFTELQGIMGRYYALLSGEKEEVAQAILEHYEPRFAGDVIPTSLEGALVSIADKIDTLAGCFAIGIEPTGSQDPYALRRQAMGVCLIIKGHKLEIGLDELINVALEKYQGIVPDEQLGDETKAKIMEFFQARVKNILSDEGCKFDVIDAVLGVKYESFLDTLARARDLGKIKDDEEFQGILSSFTRAFNLTKKKKVVGIDPVYFEDNSERELYDAILSISEKIKPLEEKRDFEKVIKELSRLAVPINNFFDKVMIMVDDEKVKLNRLGILSKIVTLTQSVGDLSKIIVK